MTLREDALGGTARRRGASPAPSSATDGRVTYKYLSADNHMDLTWYPKDIIQSRISPKYREQAPKVVETEQGTQWEWEGKTRAFAADGNDWAKYAKRFAPVEVPDGQHTDCPIWILQGLLQRLPRQRPCIFDQRVDRSSAREIGGIPSTDAICLC